MIAKHDREELIKNRQYRHGPLTCSYFCITKKKKKKLQENFYFIYLKRQSKQHKSRSDFFFLYHSCRAPIFVFKSLVKVGCTVTTKKQKTPNNNHLTFIRCNARIGDISNEEYREDQRHDDVHFKSLYPSSLLSSFEFNRLFFQGIDPPIWLFSSCRVYGLFSRRIDSSEHILILNE